MTRALRSTGALFSLLVLGTAACSDSAESPQIALRSTASGTAVTWCELPGGSIAPAAECQQVGTQSIARSRVLVSDPQTRMLHVLDTDRRAPRFIDFDRSLPGNSGLRLPGPPTQVSPVGAPGVVVAALARDVVDIPDRWDLETPGALVLVDLPGARVASGVTALSSLPGSLVAAPLATDSATWTGVADLWVALPTEDRIVGYRLSGPLADRTAQRAAGADSPTTLVEVASIEVAAPRSMALRSDGRLFVARGDRDGIDVFETAPSNLCAEPPCLAGTLLTNPSCSDGVDDDGDGLIDAQDRQCYGPGGNESGDLTVDDPAACSDGIDNDRDGAIDGSGALPDADCVDIGPADLVGSESGLDVFGPPRGFAESLRGVSAVTSPVGASNCANGIDDDGDGAIDGADPSCIPFVSDEDGAVDTSACTDGRDNDGDGLIDHDDNDCVGPADESEGPRVDASDCDNGVDDNGDGTADNCAPGRDAEGSDAPIGGGGCDDGFDNDGDGAIDWPADPQCGAPSDIESATPAACGDGIDNDGDGAADWPADPDCYGAWSSTEYALGRSSIGPMALSKDGRVLVVADEGAGLLVVFDAEHLRRIELNAGDPSRSQRGLAVSPEDGNDYGMVRALLPLAFTYRGTTGVTVTRQTVTAAMSSGYEASFDLHVVVETREGSGDAATTQRELLPVFAAWDADEDPALIEPAESFDCSVEGDAALPDEAAVCDESILTVSLPSRRRYEPTTQGVATVVDDLRVAGGTWSATLGGALPGLSRSDALLLEDAGETWIQLVGNDPCAAPDLCGLVDDDACPALGDFCGENGDDAQRLLCASSSPSDLCALCPSLCPLSGSLCDAGLLVGDRLRVSPLSAASLSGLGAACAPWGATLTGDREIYVEVLERNANRIRVGAATDCPDGDGITCEVPPAACYPGLFSFTASRPGQWAIARNNATASPFGTVAGACVLRRDAARRVQRTPATGSVRLDNGLTWAFVTAPAATDQLRWQVTIDRNLRFLVPERELFLGGSTSVLTAVDSAYGLRIVRADAAATEVQAFALSSLGGFNSSTGRMSRPPRFTYIELLPLQ